MSSEIPAPWSSGLAQVWIMKTLVPEKNHSNTSRESDPDSKSGLIPGSVFCGYQLMQVSVTVPHVPSASEPSCCLPYLKMCAVHFGGSSRFPVQLKQVQKLQPGDSEMMGRANKAGWGLSALWGGAGAGAQCLCPAEPGAPSPASIPLLPWAGIISQGICCPKLCFALFITKHTAGEDHSCLCKSCRESNKHHSTQGNGNLLMTSVDADFIWVYYLCLERLKKSNTTATTKTPNKPTKIALKPGYWNGQDCSIGV